MTRKISHFAASAIAILLLGTNCVHAANANVSTDGAPKNSSLFPTSATFDGKTYSSQDLINAFAEIAFSSYIRPNNFVYALPPSPPDQHCDEAKLKTGAICGTREDYKAVYPWLYEYIFRDNGIPRYYAINKFTEPIKISIGYPNDLAPMGPNASDAAKGTNCASPQTSSKNAQLCISDRNDLNEQAIKTPQFSRAREFAEAQKIVEAEVKAAIPIMQTETGLPVSYVPHSDETHDNFANVRIVLEDFGYNEKSAVVPAGLAADFRGNPLLRAPHGVATLVRHSLSYRDDVEPALAGIVRFTPYSAIRSEEFVQGRDNTRQVDGYLLPNADNSIGLSFCFIYVPTNQSIAALARECLLRSLGLPNAPQLVPTMALGLWNGEIPEAMRRIILGIRNPPSDLPQQLQSKEWGPSQPPITEFDRFIIRTLYSQSIPPGMSVPDFYRTVFKPNH